MIKFYFLHLLDNIFTFNKSRDSIKVICTRGAFTFEYITELFYFLHCDVRVFTYSNKKPSILA